MWDDALQGPFERDPTEAHARRRVHPRAGSRLPRRTVHHPRSHLSTEAQGLPGPIRRGRRDGVHGLPLARHRGEALRSRRGHPERLDHRDGDRGPDSGRGHGSGVRVPAAGRCMTMSWLLRLMLKEEFRVHASYSGQTMFVSFPFIITMFSLSIAVTSGRLFAYTPLPDAILLLHISVFLYGLSVGAFGFLGRQYLERTTGTRNYLVAMPGILPMRFRRTFLGMFLRDAIFYMVLLLVPATVGLALSIPVTHFRLTSIGVLFGAALLSFLLGMSLSFFVSTVYMRSRVGFVAAAAGVSALFAAAGAARAIPFSWILPSLAAHELLPPLGADAGGAAALLLLGLGIVAALIGGAVVLVPERFEPPSVAARNELPGIIARLDRFEGYSALLGKELLDFQRSGTYAKMFFSFVTPLLLLSFTAWFVRYGLQVPVGFNTVFYAGMVGFFGVILYNWMNNVDATHYFSTVPVSVPP